MGTKEIAEEKLKLCPGSKFYVFERVSEVESVHTPVWTDTK